LVARQTPGKAFAEQLTKTGAICGITVLSLAVRSCNNTVDYSSKEMILWIDCRADSDFRKRKPAAGT